MPQSERIALFSPEKPDNPVQADFTENIKNAIAGNFALDLFGINASGSIIPFNEYSWRNLKNPYDLTIYNFGSGEEYDFMLPFILIHPGLLILNRRSITNALWRMHLLDHSEENFKEEMIYNHGIKGETLSQLVWRGLWGKPFDFQFPSLRLLIEASLLTASTDPWILENANKEDSKSKTKLLDITAINSGKKISKQGGLNISIRVEEINLPQLHDMLPALKTVDNNRHLKLNILCDSKTTEECNKIINDNNIKNIGIIAASGQPAYIDMLQSSDILILIDSPSNPVHAQIILDAITCDTLPILTDSFARKYFPDEIFPKISSRKITQELLKTLELFEKDKNKLPEQKSAATKWIGKFYADNQAESLTKLIEMAIDRKKEWQYPYDYPINLRDYDTILKNQIEKKLEDFSMDGEIEKTIDYLIG